MTVSSARVDGRGDRGADALQRAGGEQPGRRLGEPAEQRGEGEEGDAGHEDPAPAEDVAGAGAEQQQAAEGQGVGVLDPGEAGGREVEVLVDVGSAVITTEMSRMIIR